MGINSKNDGSNTREEARGQKPQSPVEKQRSETKDKVRDVQYPKK